MVSLVIYVQYSVAMTH